MPLPDMPSPRHAATVYVVCLWGRVEVFDDLSSAQAFAAQEPAALINSYPLRSSADQAIVVYSRQVIVDAGGVRSDRHEEMLDFCDAGFQQPAAEVEVFEKNPGEWHVIGFGTDEQLLANNVTRAITSVISAPAPGADNSSGAAGCYSCSSAL